MVNMLNILTLSLLIFKGSCSEDERIHFDDDLLEKLHSIREIEAITSIGDEKDVKFWSRELEESFSITPSRSK